MVIFVTAATDEEAHEVAHALLKERKAACVNILSQVSSFFWWQDRLDSAQETLLIIKTKASLVNEIVKVVKEHHSYEVPEVIALPIIGGNRDYLAWIAREVK